MSKSKEGGRIYNRKIIFIYRNCMKIYHWQTGLKTYCMLKRLINK